MNVNSPTPKIKKDIWFLLCGTAAIKAANFMTIPFIAVFLAKNSELSPLQIGLIVALSPLASLVGGFLGGQLSDIVGRKLILFSSLFALSLVFFCFYVVAGHSNSHEKLMIFALLNTLCGLFSSLFHPVSAALMGDLSPVELRGKIYQLRYFFTNIGAASGPAIGGWLGVNASRDNFLYTSVFYVTYALILMAIFLNKRNVLQGPAVKKSSFQESFQALLKDKRLQRLILGGMLFNICYSQIESTVAQVLVKQFADGIQYFSYLLTANGLIVILFQAPVYWVSRKLGLNMSLLIGSVIFSIGMLVMSLQSYSVTFLFVAIFLISIGEVFVFPVTTELIEQLAPDSLRGSYFGASTFRNLGLSLGPIFGGYVLSNFGSIYLFLIISLISVVSAVIGLFGERITTSPQQKV